jgi:hypothetical protein
MANNTKRRSKVLITDEGSYTTVTKISREKKISLQFKIDNKYLSVIKDTTLARCNNIVQVNGVSLLKLISSLFFEGEKLSFMNKDYFDFREDNLKTYKQVVELIGGKVVSNLAGKKGKQSVIKIRKSCPLCGKDCGLVYKRQLQSKCYSCAKRTSDKPVINHNFYGSRKKLLHKGKIIWTRSSYESFYIDYLRKHNIDFEYEPKTFKLHDGVRYTPDFYLPATNEYIELKGFPFKAGEDKISKFKEEFPDINLRYLSTKDIITLGYKQSDFRKTFPFKY